MVIGLLFFGCVAVSFAQVPHDRILEATDREFVPQFQVKLDGPRSKFEEFYRSVISNALEKDAKISSVYRAILWTNARGWAFSKIDGRVVPKLRKLFSLYKVDRSYEQLKVKILLTDNEWGSVDLMNLARTLYEQRPDDELILMNMIVMTLGYGKVESELGGLLTKIKRLREEHPNYLGLIYISAMAYTGDGTLHKERKRDAYAKAIAEYRLYASKQTDAIAAARARDLASRLEKLLKN